MLYLLSINLCYIKCLFTEYHKLIFIFNFSITILNIDHQNRNEIILKVKKKEEFCDGDLEIDLLHLRI